MKVRNTFGFIKSEPMSTQIHEPYFIIIMGNECLLLEDIENSTGCNLYADLWGGVGSGTVFRSVSDVIK